VLARRPCRAGFGRNVGQDPAAITYRNFKNVAFGKVRFSSQPLDFAANFPPELISRTTVRWSVLRMICRSRTLPMDPPRVHPKLIGRSTQRRCIGLWAPRYSRFDLPGCRTRDLSTSRTTGSSSGSEAADAALCNVVAPRCRAAVVVGSQFSRVCPFPRSPPAGEPHRPAKRRRSTAGQRLRKKTGSLSSVMAQSLWGATNGDDGNRAFPRAARAAKSC
jgi:hypothetical protein